MTDRDDPNPRADNRLPDESVCDYLGYLGRAATGSTPVGPDAPVTPAEIDAYMRKVRKALYGSEERPTPKDADCCHEDGSGAADGGSDGKVSDGGSENPSAGRRDERT